MPKTLAIAERFSSAYSVAEAKSGSVFCAVLCRTDRVSDQSGWQLFFVDAQLLDTCLYDLGRIVGVVDRERLVIAFVELLDILPQDTDTKAVKRRDQGRRRQLGSF